MSFTFLNKSKLTDDIMKINPFITSDYHFYKKFLKDESEYYKDENMLESFNTSVINKHNKRVKENDIVLFLGDIASKTIDEDNNYEYVNKIKNLVKKMNGYLILIKGNHEQLDNSVYYKIGFKEVYDFLKFDKDKLIFTHFPFDVNTYLKGYLNIHGHIHGEANYYNMKGDMHIDAYYELYDGPIRLLDLIEIYEKGEYKYTETENKEFKNDFYDKVSNEIINSIK